MTWGVWEVRVYGRASNGSATGHRAMRVQKVYTVVEVDFWQASAHAKSLALLDGVATPVVWAATRLRDAPEHRAEYVTDGKR